MRITEVKSGQWFKHNNIEFMKIDRTKNEPYTPAVGITGMMISFSNGTEVEPLDKVLIDRHYYLCLQNRDNKLSLLEAGGVDNWESLENFKEIK